MWDLSCGLRRMFEVTMLGFWQALLPIISAIAGIGGSVAGKASQGAAQGREREALLNLDRDRLASQQWQAGNQQQLTANQEQSAENRWRALLGIEAPNTRASQVMRGDLMSNVQDVGVTGLPPQVPRIQFTGGLRPSALGPNARAAGSALSRQALQALLTGSDVPGATDFRSGLTKAPSITPLPEESGWAKAGNVLGIGGGMLGGIAPILAALAQLSQKQGGGGGGGGDQLY